MITNLLTIYKTFLRLHLNYGDVTFDQGNKLAFDQKLELFQYNAALAIKDTIRGTSKEQLCQDKHFAETVDTLNTFE